MPGPEIELRIDGMAYGGKGVARLDGKVYFVLDTVPGDVVRAEVRNDKDRYADATLLSLTTPSPLRGVPPCPYAMGENACGGCQWMGVPYAQQLEWKRSFVTQALTRIGKLPETFQVAILPSPAQLGYRNRILVRLHVKEDGKVALGYFRRASRELVAIDACAIAAGPLNDVIASLHADGLAGVPELKARLELQEVSAAPAGNVVVTVHPADGPPAAQAALVARLRALPGVRWAGLASELSDAPVLPFDHDLDIDFHTIPGQFQQVNVAHNHTLRRLVKERVDAAAPKRLLDVFCGSGNLSLPLADGQRYIEGIEANKKAILVARRNAKAHELANVNYLAGDAIKHLWKCDKGGERFDLVLLDPPRMGMYEGMVPLKNIGPKDIIYVSCDPTTLARDLGYLCRKDAYVLESVTALDFFPNTYHVEAVAFLRLKQ